MKKLLILAVCGLVSVGAFASYGWYDFRGAKKGAILESCYHDPCSVAKVIKNTIIKNNPDDDFVLIKLKLLGGSREWDSKKVIWNRQPHNVYITCSQNSPTTRTDSDSNLIPFNSELGVMGALMSDAQLYMKTCHNFDGDTADFAKKYGYDVTDYSE